MICFILVNIVTIDNIQDGNMYEYVTVLNEDVLAVPKWDYPKPLSNTINW